MESDFVDWNLSSAISKPCDLGQSCLTSFAVVFSSVKCKWQLTAKPRMLGGLNTLYCKTHYCICYQVCCWHCPSTAVAPQKKWLSGLKTQKIDVEQSNSHHELIVFLSLLWLLGSSVKLLPVYRPPWSHLIFYTFLFAVIFSPHCVLFPTLCIVECFLNV